MSARRPAHGALVADRYLVGREVARGGMGVVFEARHAATGRQIALKLVPPDAGTPELAAERLRREGRVLGMLQHPAIVQVLDAGVCRTHGLYVAMEMLEGRTLDGLLAARRKLGVPEALWVIKSIGDALAHAHARAVVHRDVKPANIFITLTPDAPDTAKLIDFGVAAFEATDGPTSAKLTGRGDLIGTLEYMAPEQLSHAQTQDPASDQYSLAMTLYEALTGELPSLSARMAVPLALPGLGQGSGIPTGVADAIVRAMQQSQSDRFPSVRAFVAALHGAVPIVPVRLLAPGLAPSVAAAREDAPTRAEGRKASEPATRRKYVRAPYITPCRVLFEDGTHVDGRTEDISEGGMLVVITGPRPSISGEMAKKIGATDRECVELRFTLPTGGAVAKQRASVCWNIDSRGRQALGVEFEQIGTDLQKSIGKYVEIIGTVEPPT